METVLGNRIGDDSMREYPWHNAGLLIGIVTGYVAAKVLLLDPASVAIVSLVIGVMGLWVTTFGLRYRLLPKLRRVLSEVSRHE